MQIELSDIEAFSHADNFDELLTRREDASFIAAAAGPYAPPAIEYLNRWDLPRDYNRQMAPSIANPDHWEKQYPHDMPNMHVHALHAPLVFGGLISQRDRRAFGQSHGPGQVLVTQAGQLLAASYGVLDGSPSLPHDLIAVEDGRKILSYRGTVETLSGTFFFLGQAHIHFGHFLLEGLSRLWALDLLPPALRNEVRFLVYEPYLTPFARSFLARLGIGEDRVVFAPPAARVENLIVPDIALRTHRWVRPHMLPVWDRIAGPPVAAGHPKVFLSRPPGSLRDVENLQAVEDVFRARDYHVVYPEQLSLAEQIDLVRSARSIASFAGSQMYLCAFQATPGDNLVIAPRNFFLADDIMIAGLRGHGLRVVFGDVVDIRPGHGWRCDIEALSRALDER